MPLIVATAAIALSQIQQAPIAATGKTGAAGVTQGKTLMGLRALAIAPAGEGSRFAVTLEDTTVRIIDATTKQTLKTFTGHPQPAYAAAWSHDGSFLATGDESARIFIWDTRTGQKIRTIYGDHTRGIQKLSFNLPRTLLMSTGKDDTINVYNVTTGKRVAQVLGKGINLYSGTFHPKTDAFLTGTLATGARVYRVAPTGAVVLNFLTGHNNQGVLDVDWNADATRAITAGKDNNAMVWDLKSLTRIATLKGHEDWVWNAKFTPNGKLAATSSPDRTVKIWDMKTFTKIGELENQSAVGSPLAFTADGKYLLSVGIDDYLQVNNVVPPQGPEPVKPPVKKPVKKGGSKKRG